jgi:hypothetical protein
VVGCGEALRGHLSEGGVGAVGKVEGWGWGCDGPGAWGWHCELCCVVLTTRAWITPEAVGWNNASGFYKHKACLLFSRSE